MVSIGSSKPNLQSSPLHQPWRPWVLTLLPLRREEQEVQEQVKGSPLEEESEEGMQRAAGQGLPHLAARAQPGLVVPISPRRRTPPPASIRLRLCAIGSMPSQFASWVSKRRRRAFSVTLRLP